VLQQHPHRHLHPRFIPYPSAFPVFPVFHPVTFIFSFYKTLKQNCFRSSFHHFFSVKPRFLQLSHVSFHHHLLQFRVLPAKQMPSPAEASVGSLVTLPGFFTTAAASLPLFIIHVSSSSWLNLSCSARDYCRDRGAYAKREQQRTLTVKVSLPLERSLKRLESRII